MNRARLGPFLFYKYCICFIIELNSFFCFGVSCCKFWGLVCARRDKLDLTMLCLQLCCYESKITCFILFVFLFTGRLLHFSLA